MNIVRHPWFALLAALVIGALRLDGFAAEPVEPVSPVRFAAVAVYLDSGTDELAAYQLSFRATSGGVKIVGIEGGEPAAFRQPPFYDPKAIQQERVILAAFSLKPANELPKGRVRVATIHLQTTGDEEPKFETKLQAAANPDGKPIPATVSVEPVTP